MEARMLLGIAAALAGFLCAYALAHELAVLLRRRKAAAAMQGESRTVEGLLAWRLRNGFKVAIPLASLLLKHGRVSRLADEVAGMLTLRGIAAAPEPLVSTVIVASIVVGAVAGVVSGSIIAAVAAAGCVLVAVVLASSNARDRRQDAVREAIPDALESMAVCFGSGFTLLQTFKQVADDVDGPLGKTFARSAHMLEMGTSVEGALEELREGANASELAFVAVALDVQHQSGGAMGQVLDAANDAVKGELALRRSLRVQTAQAKLSARVVSVMPLVLITAFSIVSPDFLMPFFTSPFGYALLAAAIAMQLAGILLVRRALTVEGVS